MRMPAGAAGAVPIGGCEMLMVRPATVADTVRDVVAVFAVTLKVTVPFPFPDAPEAMLIHELCSDADQLHPADAVTANAAGPPARATVLDVGETE